MGSGGIRRFHQRQGALSHREGSSLVRSSNLRRISGDFRRQRDCRSLSQESGRHSFGTSQFHSSEDSPLGGGASSPADSSSAGLGYVPEFVAKTETAVRSLPRTFEVKSLGDFAAGLPEELLLCPVRALSAYVARTSRFVNRPRCLFLSSRSPSRAVSKNGILYLLWEVIVQSGASLQGVSAPRAHSIRGIVTSSAFFRNWSLRIVLEVASWRSNAVFTSFYLRDLQFVSKGVHSLGPFIAAGERIG